MLKLKYPLLRTGKMAETLIINGAEIITEHSMVADEKSLFGRSVRRKSKRRV